MHLALEAQYLPVVARQRPRLDSHREHVLLVEPNEVWAEVVSQALENHGYRVTWMRSACEALESFCAPAWSSRAPSAEIVLMDIDAPDLGHWSMVVPPDTRVWPFGRVLRLVQMGHKERDLVSYFFELQSRCKRRG